MPPPAPAAGLAGFPALSVPAAAGAARARSRRPQGPLQCAAVSVELDVEMRVELHARWPLRLPRGGADGVMRARAGGVIERLLHVDGEPVVVRAAQRSARDVLLGARGRSRAAAATALERMRFALGIDDDLAPFHERFREDPLIGRLVRAFPWLRPARRPEPFEALAWAICEQLIEYTRAAAIERRIVRRFGRALAAGAGGWGGARDGAAAQAPLRDAPSAAALAGAAPALLESFDLAAGRALALRRAAVEVDRGRIDLHSGDQERIWGRLRAIPGIGSWTVASLALHGQGRLDAVPAGDLALRKLVGRLVSGDPLARAEESEVLEAFARYAPWGGLASAYAMRLSGSALPVPAGIRR
jgi:3-methyladenine DNA glycosylase/8-oxoguanine DNA glycosylase